MEYSRAEKMRRLKKKAGNIAVIAMFVGTVTFITIDERREKKERNAEFGRYGITDYPAINNQHSNTNKNVFERFKNGWNEMMKKKDERARKQKNKQYNNH